MKDVKQVIEFFKEIEDEYTALFNATFVGDLGCKRSSVIIACLLKRNFGIPIGFSDPGAILLCLGLSQNSYQTVVRLKLDGEYIIDGRHFVISPRYIGIVVEEKSEYLERTDAVVIDEEKLNIYRSCQDCDAFDTALLLYPLAQYAFIPNFNRRGGDIGIYQSPELEMIINKFANLNGFRK